MPHLVDSLRACVLRQSEEMPFHTDMGKVHDAVACFSADLHWHVSDVETNYWPHPLLGKEEFVVSDGILREILVPKDLQFFNGIFSALEAAPQLPLHAADVPGCGEEWAIFCEEPSLQRPGALFEIICFDSSETIIASRIEGPIEAFKAAFPDAAPLSKAK